MLDFIKQITQGGQLISFKLERYIQGKGGERGLREIKRKNERCGGMGGGGQRGEVIVPMSRTSTLPP